MSHFPAPEPPPPTPPPGWAHALLFAAFFAYALLLSAPHLTGGDCGEYVAAGAYLGNIHPPGNPVHHQLSCLLQLAPFGDAYQRSAALSALAAAGSVAITALLLLEMGCSAAVAFGTALLLGVSPSVMRNALVTEVYTLLLLYVALFSLAFFRLVPEAPARPDRRAFLLPFLAGFGMGVHYLSLFYVLPLLCFAWRRKRGGWRDLPYGALLFLAGASVMLYLPARALAHPPVNLGDPSTPASFLHSITRSTYLSRPAQDRTAALLLRQGAWVAESLLASISALVPALAVAGLLVRRIGGRTGILAGSALSYLAGNFLLQNFPSRELTLSEMPRFLAPALLPAYLLAGTGFEALLGTLSRPTERKDVASRRLLLSLFGALVLVAAWRSATLYSRRDDFVVRDQYREAFLALPPNAAILLDKDTQVFSAVATHFVERLRTDLLPVDRTENLLASVYGAPGEHPAAGPELERYLDSKEEEFSASYGPGVYSLTLPAWAARRGRWTWYGRIYRVEEGDAEGLFPPPSGPVRMAPAAATACDAKTKSVLVQAACGQIAALIDNVQTREVGERGLRQLEEIAWEDADLQGYFGKWFLSRGETNRAEGYLRRSLAINPRYLLGKRELGFLLARTERVDEAIPLLSDPRLSDSGEAQFHIGTYSFRRGAFVEAAERFEAAARLGYRTAPLFDALGLAYLRGGNPDKAREAFAEALRIDPRDSATRERLSRLKREGR